MRLFTLARKSPFRLLIILNLLLLTGRILWMVLYDINLYPEEAQYWYWSQHPDLAYYSKPPLIAYMNYLSTAILGNTELGIRINALMIGFILPILTYTFSLSLFKDKKLSLLSSLLLMVMPFYHAVSTLFLTDSLIILFWFLALILYYKAFHSNNLRHWIYAGLFVGLAVLSKYTALLIYPALFFYILFYRRNIFRLKGLYLSIITSILLCIPMIIGMWMDNWVGIRHLFQLSGLNTGGMQFTKSLLSLGEYIGGQLLMLSPFLTLPVLWLFFKRNKPGVFLAHRDSIIYLLTPLLFIWIFFLFPSMNRIEVNWLVFSYAPVPIIISYFLHFHYSRKFIKASILITFSVMFLFLNPWVFDLTQLTGIYPPRCDTFHRMYGYQDLGKQVSIILDRQEKDKTFLLSDSYQVASMLSFYVENNPASYCYNNGRRMNHYDLLPGPEQFENKGFDAIYVSKSEAPASLLHSFREVKEHRIIEKLYRDQYPVQFHVYLLKGFSSFSGKEIKRY